MYFCKNGRCTFSTTLSSGLKRHRCKFKKERFNSSTNHSVSLFQTSDIPITSTEIHDNVPDYIPDSPIALHNDTFPEISDEQHDFVRDFCALLTTCTSKDSLTVFRSTVSMLTNPAFDIQSFRRHIKDFKSCVKFNERSFTEIADTDGFSKFEVSFDDGDDIHKSLLYRKDVVRVLQKQVEMASQGDFIYNSCGSNTGTTNARNTWCHPLDTDYFTSFEDILRKRVMSSSNPDIFWSSTSTRHCFPGFIQVFTDKTVTTLKASGMAAHAVHAVFVNCSKEYRRYLIQNGYTIIGFLPTHIFETSPSDSIDEQKDSSPSNTIHETDEAELISADLPSLDSAQKLPQEDTADQKIVQLMDKITLTSTAKGRRVKIGLVYSSMKKILEQLVKTAENGFNIVKATCTYCCFPLLISYCCDIPEAKDMTAVKHNLNTPSPCHNCLVSLDDILELRTAPRRDTQSTLQLRKDVESQLKLNNNVQRWSDSVLDTFKFLLNFQSLASWSSFLEDIKVEKPFLIPGDIYGLFSFEPLHNLHLGISKILKQGTFAYISSNHQVGFVNSKRRTKIAISSKKTSILRACNSYLRVIDENSGITSLRVDFSTKAASATLNGLFLENGVRGMLEGKDYRNVDMVFPFVCAFLDRKTQETSGVLTKISTMNSSLLTMLYYEIDRKGLTAERLSTLRDRIRMLKIDMASFYKRFTQTGLFTLKFHLLDHLAEDLSKYCSLAYLDSSPFEQYNAVIKMHYRKTSRRHATAFQETIGRIGSSTKTISENLRTTERTDNTPQSLVKNGTSTTLHNLRNSTASVTTTALEEVLENLKSHIVDSDIPVLIQLIDDQLREECAGVHDTAVHIIFVNSGFIDGCEVPTLDDYDEELNIVPYNFKAKVGLAEQRVIASNCFGSSSKNHHSTVILRGRGDVDEFWFAQVISLFHISVPQRNYSKQVSFLRYFHVTEPSDQIDRILGCICLRWETEDGVDHTKRQNRLQSSISVGEQYGLVSFQSLCGVVHIIRSNYALPPFSKELPWPYHKFYVNKFLYKC